jgi:iron complex outermembrane receptor protein
VTAQDRDGALGTKRKSDRAMNVKSYLLATSTLVGAALIFAAAPTAGFAQDTTSVTPATPPPADQTATPQDESTEVQQIVVTGSRIRRTEFTSPLPIQVLTTDQARLNGVNSTAELLQNSTIASGSPQVTSAISSAFVTEGGPGAETVSLRGLGAERTLVLINSKRAGPAGTHGSVAPFDLSVLPQSIISRAEILKDGASSVYGSDAVAGVVNLITRHDDGGEINGFASVPFESGGEQYQADGYWGKVFDRGYFGISFDYNHERALRTKDRDFLNCAENYTFDAATGRRNDIIDVRTGRPACRVQGGSWEQLWIYEYGDDPIPGTTPMVQYNYPGNNLDQYLPQRPNGGPGDLMFPTGWFAVNYDPVSQGLADFNSPYLQNASIIPQRTKTTLFAQGDYEINDAMTAYTEVLLNRRETKTTGYRQFWTYLMTSDFFDWYYNGYYDQFDPSSPGDPFSAGWTGNAYVSPTIGTDHFGSKTRVDYGRAVIGLRGDLPDSNNFLGGWHWDVFAQVSRSHGVYTDDVILNDALLSQSFRNDLLNPLPGWYDNSVPRDTASCVGYTLPVSNKPCIDLNFLTPDFMRGNLTPEEKAFLFDVDRGVTNYTQAYIEGSISGDAFQLPAGPAAVSVGFHLRRDDLHDTPGPITQAGNSWGLSASGVTKGHDITKELFGEVSLPLVKDVPYVQLLDLSLSGRYTDVQSYGSNNTYRVAVNWKVNPTLRFRATQGTSFRAPALFNQHLANETGFLSQRSIDPCVNWPANLEAHNISQQVADNCANGGGQFNLLPVPEDYTGRGGGAEILTGGGPNLKAETSKAFTAGFVVTPPYLDLSVAVDYFDIQIDDEITSLGGLEAVACYQSHNFPNDPVCGLFTRDPTLFIIDQIQDPFLNIATQRNRGIDLSFQYRRDLGFANLTVDGQSTWQLQDTTQLFAGFEDDPNGFVGDPDWSGILNLQLVRGDWTAHWGVQAYGKASDAEIIGDTNAAGTTRYKVHTELTAYHSVSLQRKYEDWTVLVGVANVFNEEPPALTTIDLGEFDTLGTSAFYSQYDLRGRRAFVNINKKF